MDYRVEELAAAAGIRVDTLRFYQARGILLPPRRQGRIAVYGDDHLARLRRIRELKRDGFSLAQIQKVMAESAGAGESKAGSNESLLDALVEAPDWCETVSACGDDRTLCVQAAESGDDSRTAAEIEANLAKKRASAAKEA